MSEVKVEGIMGYFEASYEPRNLGISFGASDESEWGGGIFTVEQAREAARALFNLADEMALHEGTKRS